MRNLIVFFLIACSCQCLADAREAMDVREVTFKANGLELSGLLSTPTREQARALVIIVHGYGTTNVVKGNQYHALRSRFASVGVASFVWDKPGRGDSEGEFDPQQSVHSSAREVVAAAAFLREQGVPGAGKIGLWGISRAGWIAPLALAQDKELAFWISVSGVDANESFGYLLESNWRIEGRSEPEIAHLLGQWREGNAIILNGGTYAEFVAATEDYYADSFVHFVSGRDSVLSEAAFDDWKATWETLSPNVDSTTGLIVYVDDFVQLLSSLEVPVLAIFGEQDTSVDWRAARALYEGTIGKNPDASLSVLTFSDANHNMHVSETGGFREMMGILKNPQMVTGYYELMLLWLEEATR